MRETERSRRDSAEFSEKGSWPSLVLLRSLVRAAVVTENCKGFLAAAFPDAIQLGSLLNSPTTPHSSASSTYFTSLRRATTSPTLVPARQDSRKTKTLVVVVVIV